MIYKFVQTQKDRKGNLVYYFRRSKKDRRYRLPDDPSSREFHETYMRFFTGEDIYGSPTVKQKEAQDFREKVIYEGMRALRLAMKRASERSKEFDLDRDWVRSRLEESGYACPLTGISFNPDIVEGRIRPFCPSIDRLNNSRGYTKDNCRIIISAMNIMLSTWGDGVFENVAKAFLREKRLRTRRERSKPSRSESTPHAVNS